LARLTGNLLEMVYSWIGMAFTSGNIKQRVRAKVSAWRNRLTRELSRDEVGGTSEGNKVAVYFDGDEAFNSMIDAISKARHYVHLEMYMFFSDNIGSSFADALAQKAREGVPVRVLYDSIGSLETDKMQWARMRDAGVTVVEYRPVAFWRKRSGIFGRNHRKNLVIDGVTGFTGGMNISDEWSEIHSGDSAWRDTHCRVDGPAARHLNDLFVSSWQHATEERIFHRPDPNPLDEAEKKPHPDLDNKAGEGCRCIVIGSRGLGNRKEIRRLFSVHLAQAQESVRMTMPYFVPPKRLRKAVYMARKRGVDVSALLPRDSDVKIVDYLREGLYPKMLSMGVLLIEYLGPVLHAKTMVVDDNIAVIGSSNFDILSVRMNSEVALVVFDEDAVDELNRQWENDLSLSERVGDDWKITRPWWRLLAAKIGCLLIRRM
jgi:cardiolipin synthase